MRLGLPIYAAMKEPSPKQVERAERMRAASETGAKARADIEARDIAVRKNMERLRALRLAREAEDAAKPKPEPVKKAGKARAASRKAAAPKKLSEWMAAERAAGRKT